MVHQAVSVVTCLLPFILDLSASQFYPYRSNNPQLQSLFNYNFFSRQNYFAKTSTTTTTTTTTTPRPSFSNLLIDQYDGTCGVRYSGYRPNQRARRGRIIWTDEDSKGANSPEDGSFPWLASLFLRQNNGEAYFMCAATILTTRVLVSAAHCFNDRYQDTDWFVRVGDNFMASRDPSEQTFQVGLIVKHEKFIPLSSPGGDGRNDIALLYIRTSRGRGISFDKFVTPACLPTPDLKVKRWSTQHCEIAGWGMQEYNNTNSYPDSVRAAKITVNTVPSGVCDYLYGRDVDRTGKFCAGGTVDACQEDSGGPLMCSHKNKYTIVGIISSGKGCGSYPGLYTDVARYVDWIVGTVNLLENEIELD